MKKSVVNSQWSVVSSEPTTDHGPRTTDYGLRTADRGPRSHSSFIIHHSSFRAFTLIELIIVISIMALLASLTFPIMGAVKKTMLRNRAIGGLKSLETSIEAYKDKFGHYPPDNGGLYSTNQLFYELVGTTNAPPYFKTLDGGTQILKANLPVVFASGVSGFVNCSQAGNADEAPTGMSFLRDLKANQFMVVRINSNPNTDYTTLGSAVDGPADLMLWDPNGQKKINPWRYNSSNPVHNPKSFDLWIDILVGGKTNRICNWSDQALLVGP